MWVKARGVSLIWIDLSSRRPGERRDPIRRVGRGEHSARCVRLLLAFANQTYAGIMGPRLRGDDGRIGWQLHHGIAKRSVLPPLLMSTAAKPIAARPRVPQSPCSLISNLLSRVQSWVVPPQFSGLSLNLRARLSASTTSAKLKICFG